MFKLMFGLPLLLAIAGAFVLGSVLLVPLFAVGAVILGLTVAFGAIGLVLRIVAGVLIGAGSLVFGVLGIVLALVAGALILALGAALLHLLLPVLVVIGIIWVIRRNAKPQAPLQITHQV